MRAKEFIDNINGLGAVPWNQDVDYKGLRVHMKPSTFLRLAAISSREPSEFMIKHIAAGKKIGAPFLLIQLPKDWIYGDGKLNDFAKVVGHEGRHRMKAIMSVKGDIPVEVHLLMQGFVRRNLNDAIIEKLNDGLYSERAEIIIRGPLFML